MFPDVQCQIEAFKEWRIHGAPFQSGFGVDTEKIFENEMEWSGFGLQLITWSGFGAKNCNVKTSSPPPAGVDLGGVSPMPPPKKKATKRWQNWTVLSVGIKMKTRYFSSG